MTDQKEFDPFDFVDDDFIESVVEVAEELERDTLTPLVPDRPGASRRYLLRHLGAGEHYLAERADCQRENYGL